MSTAQDGATRKNKAVSNVGNISRDRTDKGDDKVDVCGRGSWWQGTLKDTPIPGVYHIRDFIEEAELNPHLNTSPCDYNLTAKLVEKIPCKHGVFRSTVQRISFPPREGPSPCHYNPQTRPGKGITSCFKSNLPRLHCVHSKTPGPGAYEPCWKLGDRLNTEAIDPSFSLFFR
uniref:protein STPG4 isoform X3 n=1 Tax=Gasterosteus aculeatus aculeatus TaxID=481459 RepID=UPI001A9932A7|nr:protein STPG4 isoform X3 [Gasterosteus aculeatus aculeatus]